MKKLSRDGKIGWLAILGITVAIAAWCFFSLKKTERETTREHKPEIKSGTGVKTAENPAVALGIKNVTTKLDEVWEKLAVADSETGSVDLLKELRTSLDQLSSDNAAAMIADFLATGNDASTHLKFAIGPDGFLIGAPSLRIFLLDYLGAKNPKVAGDMAAQIFQKSQAPDEWAVALRDYAKSARTSGEIAFLETKTRELLNRDDWLNSPSSGVLEAFDVVVYTKDFSALPRLATLAKPDADKAVSHAAFLTLDRLALTDPASFMRVAQQNSAAFSGREMMRANLFARADVRMPEQLNQLENYLLDANRSQEELATFAGVYPNANYMISNNLLTRPETPHGTELANRDRAALQQTERWLDDPRFAKIRPQVEAIKARLQRFVPKEN